MMSRAYHPERPSENSVLKLIFDRYAEETFSEEQLRRVIEPVLRMIKEGKFSRRSRASRVAKPGPAVAVAPRLARSVPPTKNGAAHGIFVDMPAPAVPMSETFLTGGTLTGRVILRGSGLNGIELALVNTDNEKIIGMAVTDQDGVYHFDKIPAGTYRLQAALPPGLAMMDGKNAGTWTGADGNTELAVCADGQESWKEMDIWVCAIAR